MFHTHTSHAPRWCSTVLLCAAVLVLSAGCGSGTEGTNANTTPEPVTLTGIEAAEPLPTAVASTNGCALDSDCAGGLYCFLGTCAWECKQDSDCVGDGASCTARGKCITGEATASEDALPEEEALAPEALPTLTLAQPLQRVYHVESGQQEVTLTLELDQAPGQTIGYRVDRVDRLDDAQQIHHMEVEGTTATITLPVGDASPDRGDQARTTDATIHTPFGSYVVSLVPSQAAAGAYAGAIAVETFGSTGLPVTFDIVTQPAGASLQTAEKAWMVLPVGESAVFSPVRGEQVPMEAVSELIYDDFTRSWVATFTGAFDLTDGVVLRYDGAAQVGRSMRFEIEQLEGDEIYGSFRDRWSGLYDERSADGVTAPADVTYRGSFSARRVGLVRQANQIDPEATIPAAASTQQQPPALGVACMGVAAGTFDATFTDDSVDPAVSYGCDTIASVADFEAANAQDQGSCAVAIAHQALAGDTTAKQIQAFLDDATPNPGSMSFTDFMEECAAGTNGTCRPSQEVLCARQLVASATRTQPKNSPLSAPLIAAYTDVSREAFLGRQFGAYRTDIETRLDWLKSLNYPAVVTSAVRNKTEELLDGWRDNVLEVHFQVLQGQFDRAGLSVLAREPEGQAAIEERQELLLEMNQSFRAAMDALTLAAMRWDVLYLEASERRERAAYVADRARQLYLLAGVLKQLNLSAGVGSLSAGVGAGFAALSRELDQLDSTFNELLYARDAEVVLNTSVDPTMSDVTLLAELKKEAEEEIASASVAVQAVIDESEAQALSETQLRNRMNNEISALRDELVELCGLPQGCSTSDLDSRPECAPRVEPGECGFSFATAVATNYAEDPDAVRGAYGDLTPQSISASEGGRTLMAIIEAIEAQNLARTEHQAQVQRITLLAKNTQAYEEKVKQWTQDVLRYQQQLEENTQVLLDSNDREHHALVEMITGTPPIDPLTNEPYPRQMPEVRDQNGDLIEGGQAALRKRLLDEKQMKVDGWYQKVLGRTIEKWATEVGFGAARFGIEQGFGTAISGLEEGRDAELSAIPGEVEDPFSALRVSINLRYAPMIIGLKRARNAANFVVDKLEWANERRLEIEALKREEATRKFEQKELWNEEAIQRVQDAFDIRSSEEDGLREATRDTLHKLSEAIKISRALERDTVELQDRRTELLQEMTELAALEVKIQQASLGIDQRMLDYDSTVQRAQLLAARLSELERQRGDVNQLLGSPTAVFSRANKVVQAESRLERAKGYLMDWLVALEYYAVRPFMDQRIQIMLARNPNQLEKIAKKMADLQAKCGGATNEQVSELSLRDDLLQIDQPWYDAISEITLSPGGRLRQMMREGYIPIDRRVRYTANADVGSLLERTDGSVLTASFGIDLEDFANLEATCNAKVKSVEVQLVGQGLGEGQPTVSVFYDGAAVLQSCQPGIDTYVEQFGPGTTRFGARTLLNTTGRGISPVAGVNAFPTGAPNTTLAGLPLASEYTVLIDTQIGENSGFDWSELEDIRLRVTYSYQDLFPMGQCE